LKTIREGLRSLREREHFTLDEANKVSGVDRAVIHRIENTKKYPKYEPGIETVRRLVEGMGISLAQFFNELERAQDAAAAESHSPLHNPSTVVQNPHRSPASTTDVIAELPDGRRLFSDTVGVEVLIAGFGETLSEAISHAADRVVDRLEQIASPRRTKAHRREGGRVRRAKAG
jgi:transcriptional regulator with XRE-family HTH domain